MVRSLCGKCQGQSINFTQDRVTGRWVTTVPATQDGRYIIELWAQDYAGNIGYFATIEVTWDSTRLCMKISILKVGSMFSISEVKKMILGDGVMASAVPWPMDFSISPDTVMSKVIKCERCCR